MRCCICGVEISITNAQLLVLTKRGGYQSACLSHENSKELQEYIKENGIREGE